MEGSLVAADGAGPEPDGGHAGRGAKWTEAELEAAVAVYNDMLGLERRGTPYRKSEFRARALGGALAQRSAGSFERRMGNISHLRLQAGLDWIEGYKPYGNVGRRVVDVLTAAIGVGEEEALDLLSSPDPTTVMERAFRLGERQNALKTRPTGDPTPARSETSSRGFLRSPEVVGWVLRRARGVCECCGREAPFVARNGRPFLEVHHVVPLSTGGPDTVTNVAAVCPNCHRRCHFAPDADSLNEALAVRVARLEAEAEGS